MVEAMFMVQRLGSSVGVDARGIVGLILRLIVYGIIFGILYFLITKAPFIPDTWKTVIIYILYALAAVAIIYLLLGLVGG